MVTIYQSGEYRITEILDEVYDIDELKGDTYCPKVNNDIPTERLKEEEIAFEQLVFEEGVYGYVLEKWDPDVNMGWIDIYSCWGFVGRHVYEDHYIVDEMKQTIHKGDN